MFVPSYRKTKTLRQRGFTVVELVIATTVFSIILLVITFAILQISRSYYKGVNEAATQTVARNIMDSIGQSIQFSGGAVDLTQLDTAHVFCIGSQKYTVNPGRVVVDGGTLDAAKHETRHGLYVQDVTSYCDPSAGVVDMDDAGLSGGRELLSPNMRIADLSITPNAGNVNQYKITIRLIYGQDDFIYSPTVSSASLAPAAPDATCKGSSTQAGRSNRGAVQFCSVSELSTTVTKRVR